MKNWISPLLCFFALTHADATPLPKLAGWQGPLYVETYTPDNLYERINGSAPSYHAYGFKKLFAGEYENEGGNISVEIYQHETPSMALGIYSSERSRRGSFLEVGYEGYLLKDFAAFVSGPYYVKIDLFELPDDERAKIPQRIAEIENGLVVSDKTIKPLTLFPKENQVPHTARLTAKDYLGHPCLTLAYEVTYATNDRKYRAFLMQKASAAECEQTIQAYLKAIKLNRPVPANETVALEDRYNGTIYLHHTGNTVIGIWGNTDEAAARQTIESIKAKLKK